ncbi:hypothetical protein A2914_02800 [Candidatus Nomurabacteria bacterium RIFCSPLOWO2_01_FULL_41_21]|uniref:Type II methyltransferase M.TaqI-like domain-containing protein n=2 Tax=Candidatus Nomuraibacteriota TaxID=1752729 RepID=A0A1F6X409_9BACT|nr:MAG: hypothetical protein A2647_02435 [Candidatus Nomurabacteria bacterium RIFCSPHIGHO2_01_FULL_40_24b]OGI88862.1 MAG: hypothetical protein A2914_02800 [Candidatus Nomurabacteria bacterium RIFCSPLOWO2_01_FULL_41_21]
MTPTIKKKNLGQFFTSNANYIFKGFEKFVKDKNITDPFAGNGDLLNWAKSNGASSLKGFDVDKSLESKIISFNDSLLNPKKYKFIITNPPYLNINKASRETKDKYFFHSQYEDLYQISLSSILNSEEGIIVVPINFLSAENSTKIRDVFFGNFEIIRLNIFKHRVFEDTSYNVISFYFRRKKNLSQSINKINATIFPEGEKIFFTLKKEHNWQFGGEFLKKIQKVKNHLGVKRLTREFLDEGNEEVILAVQNPKYKTKVNLSSKTKKLLENNIIVLKAIDSKNGDQIKLDDIRNYDVSGILGKNTSRNMAHLIFNKNLPLKEQEKLIEKFNSVLYKTRQKYFSLFLTNFRDNGRKRISFDFSYKFLNYLYQESRR